MALHRLKDQVVNRLSMLFGASYIHQDLGVQMEDKEYIFVITYEQTEKNSNIARKFRVLLLQLGAEIHCRHRLT